MTYEQPIESFQGAYRFLSNFWPAEVEYEGLVYPSSEHAYQAAKTIDPEARKAFLDIKPGQAKRKGRKVVLREDWEDVKLDVMLDLLRAKFSNPELTKMLLDTGDRGLIEGNTWGDQFWGVCKGQGENHLGLLLMQVRDEIGTLSTDST